MSLLPVAHSFPRSVEVAGRDSLAFVADTVNEDDAALFHKEPNDPRVQFADVRAAQISRCPAP